MVRSGLIFGAVSFFLILASAILITPFCAPCIGLILGLGAGYVAANLEKTETSGESIKKGAIAGAIAGGLGFVGGMIAGVINGLLVNPADLQNLYNLFGLPNVNLNQSSIWIVQLLGAGCIGLFDIGWMAILGVAGGAFWYQVTGQNQTGRLIPPQEPLPPEN